MQAKGIEGISSAPGTWYGKMWPGHSAATNPPISGQSLKKPRKSRIKMPLYLNLRKENGLQAAVSWETGGALLTEFSMHSFGECPSVDVESRLSQILEENPPPKYSLSAKACTGILNRAKRRGKPLPPELEEALVMQAQGSR